MAKLTFSWSMRGEEARPNKTDVKNLKAESFIFQMDFLQDVMAEAEKLYAETMAASELDYHMRRMERSNGSSTTH